MGPGQRQGKIGGQLCELLPLAAAAEVVVSSLVVSNRSVVAGSVLASRVVVEGSPRVVASTRVVARMVVAGAVPVGPGAGGGA
jgi:hypothetical protein